MSGMIQRKTHVAVRRQDEARQRLQVTEAEKAEARRLERERSEWDQRNDGERFDGLG